MRPNSLDAPKLWIPAAEALLGRAAGTRVRGLRKCHDRILQITSGRCRFEANENLTSLEFAGVVERLGRMTIEVLTWSGASACETTTWRTKDHHLSLQVPLAGEFEAKQGGEWLLVEPKSALIVAGSGETRRRWRGASCLLNIMIDRQALDQNVMRVAGSSDILMTLPSISVVCLANFPTLCRFITMVLEDLSADEPMLLYSDASYDADRLLVQLLVKVLDSINQTKPVRERHVIVPAYIRSAERFIKQNYAYPLSLHKIASACNVSGRTLQYGFNRYRSTTPIEFLKDIRLTRSRQQLLTGDANSIADLARSVGYRSHSQFTRDYRQAFGESPKATRASR